MTQHETGQPPHGGMRDEALAARRRMDLLVAASERLAGSLDPQETLLSVARCLVPDVADWCRIDLLDEHGRLQRRLAYHTDPQRSQEALEMARSSHASPGTVGSTGWVVRTGESYHGEFRFAADDPGPMAAFVRRFGMRSHYILPLVARGRTIGAMGVLQAESGRTLSEDDRALIREIALRAAVALDNARLFAQAEAAHRRLELLAAAGERLASSLDPQETLLSVARSLVPTIADWCRIDLLDEAGRPRREIAYHVDAALAERALQAARELQARPDTTGTLSWVMRTGQPYHGDFADLTEEADPALHRYTAMFGMREHVIIPLIARGRTIGAMAVVQAESGRSLGEDDRKLVLELGRRAALALDNARLFAAAEAARAHAESANRAKDEFLAMLGHELRNPLAPMATALHLMARKGDPGTRAEREVMQRQVAHMKRLVDDLLDVSRITGKRLEMRMQPLALADLVRHAGQSVQSVLGLRRLDLQVEPDAEDLWVSADEVRLGQVLNNLLGNAIKFTGPQGTIALRLRRVGDQAEVSVADDGVGMPPEVLQHVFDLFYQAPQGADRSRGGLGLGLAIVRSLVEMHGGTVAADSAGEGQGSTITLRLPTVSPPPPVANTQGQDMDTDGKGRVLLVDDNQDAADTASTLLELSGYQVKVAYDPGVALALLEQFAPQVAVLDIGLPGMSGYELAAQVRAHRNGASCYLVALTGYGTQADVAKAHAAGFRQHLVKPARPEALLEAVQRGLQDNEGSIP
jgi:signal transduction histidine kinase/ActR/RegA family two-component response regulator